MSEKHLTELPWKMLALQQNIKETNLQKALLAYSKLDSKKEPAKTHECLVEIAEHALKIKKANAAKKELTAYLDEIIKEANKTKQAITLPTADEEPKVAQKPAPAPIARVEDAEDTDIKSKLLAGLKKVKELGGKESIPFVACITKPFYGLLFGKTSTDTIGATHKKILTDLTNGTKFIVGTCLFESNAHTFVVDPVPGGLAKNLTAAIKKFSESACKVRVRDTEGTIVADSDTDTSVEEVEGHLAGVAPKAASAPPPRPESPAPLSPQDAEAMAAFSARLKTLQPEVQKVPDKTPAGIEIRQKAAQAAAFASKKSFGEASAALDTVALLVKKALASPTADAAAPKPNTLGQRPPPPQTPPAQNSTAPQAQPQDVKLSTYLNGKANLRKAREDAQKELLRLRQTILDKCKGEPFYSDVESKSQKLLDFLAPIDDSVSQKLDEASKCLDAEVQPTLNNKARELIQKQLTALRSHALSSFVEKNPFGRFIIKQPLEVTLADLDRRLS